MDKIYHCCRKGHPDGLDVVIEKYSNCLLPTANCFWKDPRDVINAVKTCSQTENKKL